MRHIDLFTGICGFALAAKIVWGDEYENICFCDNNPFCREVIKKNFGEVMIYDDIRIVSRERLIADTNRTGSGTSRSETIENRQENSKEREHAFAQFSRQSERAATDTGCERPKECEKQTAGIEQYLEIDLLTGGFPCQPFSQAGKRKGTSDDRHLWPEMLRVIKDFKPRWVIGENVRGILTIEQGMVFEQVCLDLEGEGYAVQAFVIPAVAVNAPHRRDRVWIVANTRHRNAPWAEEYRESKRPIPCAENAVEHKRPNSDDGERNAPDTGKQGLEGCGTEGKGLPGQQDRTERNEGTDWDKNWIEVATEFCRVDDGFPVELDGFKLSKSKHREERLKALGNAIVPQVAVEIMKAIKDIGPNT